MLRLIEKIVDKCLANEFYALMVLTFLFMIIGLLGTFCASSYRTKLDTDVTLAKIAAGQVVDGDKHE